MIRNSKKIFLLITVVSLLALGCNKSPMVNNPSDEINTMMEQLNNQAQVVNFNDVAANYLFRAELPIDWKIEYLSNIDSINIYNPVAPGQSNLDKSQIFIRNFRANSFLTLSTVDILQREETKINGHQAVRYEIKKKIGVADFPNQPYWRNQQHKLVDIRERPQSPSWFYVFSYNPQLNEQIFENFLSSLIFNYDLEPDYNSNTNTETPLRNAQARITKKPFGIYITQATSPVQPERFSGYHTGTDFEIYPFEENIDVPVYTICSGPLLQKRTATGYGGVAVQSCNIDNQAVTVVYGHVRLSSVTTNVGTNLNKGQQIALLGNGNSAETDGERKHLHLSIHKGTQLNIAGYVSSQGQLNDWLDYQKLSL